MLNGILPSFFTFSGPGPDQPLAMASCPLWGGSNIILPIRPSHVAGDMITFTCRIPRMYGRVIVSRTGDYQQACLPSLASLSPPHGPNSAFKVNAQTRMVHFQVPTSKYFTVYTSRPSIHPTIHSNI